MDEAALTHARQFLNAREAVDLALFRGAFCKGLLSMPDVEQVLLAELTWPEARSFITQVDAAGLHFEPRGPQPESVFFVVLRGDVQNKDCSFASPDVGPALAAVFTPAGGTFYIGWGVPWDAVAPPGSLAQAIPDGPNSSDVSLAYARDWVPVVTEPNELPPNLHSVQVSVNDTGPLDPTGARMVRYERDTRSVTLVYEDPAGQERLWLSETWFFGELADVGRWTPVRLGTDWGSRYEQDVGGVKYISVAWESGDVLFYLTGAVDQELTEHDLVEIASSMAAGRPIPTIPSIAPAPGVSTSDVVGKVVVEGGQDHAGTMVRVGWVDDGPSYVLHLLAVSGRDGSFLLRDVPVGRYVLVFTRTGFPPTSSGLVEVANGDTTTLHPVILANSALSVTAISGRVVLRGETDHSGGRIEVTTEGFSRMAVSVANGEFAVTDIPMGDYIVRFAKPGFDASVVSIAVGESAYVTLPDVELSKTRNE